MYRRGWSRTSMRIGLAVAALSALATLPAVARAAPISCGQTITQSITLTADLNCGSGTGIVIGADGITLDLNHHTIAGNGTTSTHGVEVGSHNRVIVKGGTISGFSTAVDIGSSAGNGTGETLTGITFYNNQTSIQGDADRSLIAGNTSAVTRPSDGVFGGDFAISGARNWVTGNNALNNFFFVGGTDNQITYNHVGIFSTGAGGNVAAHNTALEILLSGGDPNAKQPTAFIVHNLVAPAAANQVYGEGGIIISEASHMFIAFNRVIGPPAGTTPVLPTGIEFSLLEFQGVANGNVLVGNVVRRASIDGIAVSGPSYYGPPGQQMLFNNGVTNTVLIHNRASHNGHDGINNQSSSTTLTGNIANFNGNLGIESVAGAKDGGGNRAHGNGNAAQCGNVSCS